MHRIISSNLFTINMTLFSYDKPFQRCVFSQSALTHHMKFTPELFLYLKVEQQLTAAVWTLKGLSVNVNS